jgi:hypothetical protein
MLIKKVTTPAITETYEVTLPYFGRIDSNAVFAIWNEKQSTRVSTIHGYYSISTPESSIHNFEKTINDSTEITSDEFFNAFNQAVINLIPAQHKNIETLC